jgi:hypothetical protein
VEFSDSTQFKSVELVRDDDVTTSDFATFASITFVTLSLILRLIWSLLDRLRQVTPTQIESIQFSLIRAIS